MKKTIHKTRIVVTVLSEEAYGVTDLVQIHHDIHFGGCSGQVEIEDQSVLDDTDYEAKAVPATANKLAPHGYRVRWEIDIDASSPEEAARRAREIQLDDQSDATVFVITDEDGGQFEIDLLDAAREENAGTSPQDLRYLIEAHVKAKGRIEFGDPDWSDQEVWDNLSHALVFRPRNLDEEIMPYALFSYRLREGGFGVGVSGIPANRRRPDLPFITLDDVPLAAIIPMYQFLINKKL